MKKDLVWFFGIVEDVHDPKELGRVQVRCFGYHSHDENDIPTEALPWATVMAPTTSSSFRGINSPMHGLMIGSTVFGFFLDGSDAQYPMIVGSIPGKANNKKPNPATSYALDEQLDSFVPGEADVGTLSQSGAPDTLLGKAFIAACEASMTNKVNTASAPNLQAVDGTGFPDSYFKQKTWNKPPARGGSNTAQYSMNKVVMSQSGHVEEKDDTPGNERLMKFHRSGTYQEFDAGGNLITHVVSDKFDVIIGNDNILVKGDCNLTVEGNVRQLVVGNYHLEVYGDYTEKIHGSRKVKITENDLKEVTGYQTSIVEADKTDTITGRLRTNTGNGWKQYICGDYDINVGGLAPSYSLTTGPIGGINIEAGVGGFIDIHSSTVASIKGGISTNIGDPTALTSQTLIWGNNIVSVANTNIINSATSSILNVASVISDTASISVVGAVGGSTITTTSAGIVAVAPLITLN